VLLAVMLTGKILTAVCAAGVFLCYIPFLWALQRVLRIEFFNTSLNSGYFALSSVPVVKCSSPWVFALYQMTQGGRTGLTGKFPTVTELCQLLAIAVLLTGISLLLYRIRKTEAAGQALAFRRTEGVIKLLLTVPVTIMSALVGYELFRSVVWEIVFLLLFGGLACMIMEFMYRWDIRQVAQHRLHMVATVVLAGLVFFAFQFDLTGYNTYLPAKEDLAGMAVRDMYLEICYPEVTGSYANTNADAQKLLDYFETDDVDLLYSLAENGVAHVRGTEETSEPTVYVEIKYHTKSGKEVYRGYYVDEELFLDTMDGMMKDAEFREKYFPILSWDEEQIRSTIAFVSIAEEDANGIWYERSGAGDDTDETEGTVAADASAESSDDESEEYYEDWTDDSGSLSLDIPVSDLEEVVEAYCSDLQMTSWRDIWMTGSYLSFEHPQEPASWYSYDLYPFSGSFEQTMEVMRKIQETK
jgi:ABC-2 type transport system permease protein